VITWLGFEAQLLPNGWSAFTPGLSADRLQTCQDVYLAFLGVPTPGFGTPAFVNALHQSHAFVNFFTAANALTHVRRFGRALDKPPYYPPQVTTYVSACRSLLKKYPNL
jgi:hypothetical protein